MKDFAQYSGDALITSAGLIEDWADRTNMPCTRWTLCWAWTLTATTANLYLRIQSMPALTWVQKHPSHAERVADSFFPVSLTYSTNSTISEKMGYSVLIVKHWIKKCVLVVTGGPLNRQVCAIITDPTSMSHTLVLTKKYATCGCTVNAQTFQWWRWNSGGRVLSSPIMKWFIARIW